MTVHRTTEYHVRSAKGRTVQVFSDEARARAWVEQAQRTTLHPTTLRIWRVTTEHQDITATAPCNV